VAGVVAAITVMFRGAPGGAVPGDQPIAQKEPVQPAAVAVARLNRAFDCVWSSETHSPAVGDDLVAGRKLVLKAGLVEIVFRNGAQAIVEGPAVFEVASRSGGRLSRGKCAVTVEDPAARGFMIDAPGMIYTDLGTEFGVSVAQNGEQEMHVFRGKVQAELASARQSGRGGEGETSHSPAHRVSPSPSLVLSAHEAIRVAAANAAGGPAKPIEHIAADEKQFVRNDRLAQVAALHAPPLERWKYFSEELCKRQDLAAYYDFQPDANDRTVLRNRASTGRALDGRIEGAAWADGQMPGKSALRFAGRDDRVRVDIPGSYDALTLAAWVNVDDLDNEFNSILNSDRWLVKAGQFHWEFRPDGTAASGICWATGGNSASGVGEGSSGTVLAQQDLGAWRHIAVVYDSRARSETFFVDGRPCGTVNFKTSLPLVFGSSQIGNWVPVDAKEAPVRNLHGRIAELAVIRSALSEAEVRRLYENSMARSGDVP
jgi:hypothetical protein